jgi:branched-chain amino acid transport system ATP-binding protein
MTERLLEVRGVHTHYGPVHAVKGVSFHINGGETIALLGANGAGKSTVLRTIAGVLQPSSGDIVFAGRSIGGLPSHQIALLGISLVPEGRRIFPNLTTQENLRMGAYGRKEGSDLDESWDLVYELFPLLRTRARQLGSSLSGGEQQMLAISRALMAKPILMLLDEPSLGLAPLVARNVFNVVRRLAEQNVTVMLVEQNVRQALRIAGRGYVLEVGRLVHQGPSEELLRDEAVAAAYFGRPRRPGGDDG